MYVSGYPCRFCRLGGRGGSGMYKSTLPRGSSRKTRHPSPMLRKNVSVYMLVVVPYRSCISAFTSVRPVRPVRLVRPVRRHCFLSGDRRGHQPISSFISHHSSLNQIIFTFPERRFFSSAGNWSSVTNVSMSARWAKVKGNIAPTLLESTTITTRRARRITARFNKASS